VKLARLETPDAGIAPGVFPFKNLFTAETQRAQRNIKFFKVLFVLVNL
jgi:hypothetical protein